MAEHEHVLGRDAATLRRIFPDGVARLWGSTPTNETGNRKAVALRDRQSGDEVLFYADKKFVARARILACIDNRALAAAVWGEDAETGSTWEHIIALGDVEEFEVDAYPVLTELGVPRPLRSLTLVPATERLRCAGLVPSAGAEAIPPASTASPRLGRDQLMRALGTLNTHIREQRPDRHEPLSLLWAIGRVAAGADRLAPWDVFQREVGSLLKDFGVPGSGATPEYPFWHLRSSGVWELRGIGAHDLRPTPAALRAAGARAGFTQEAARHLRRALTRAESIALLSSRYLADVDREALLGRVGLAGYATASGRSADDQEGAPGGPVGRRSVTSSRPDRDRGLAEDVKVLHGHQCQVCGLRLETQFRHYSEAAHIRGVGEPHGGPDRLSNLLCLCPNHHAQFDRLGIYIDQDWSVRRTRDAEFVGRLRFHPEHVIDEQHVEYHRGLCGRNG
ncbi:HNH endonuclease [Streptomyces sp. NPDC048338]|uniref:HNH endonuclease n=1 Tax=Streptomyces sp. NPDC048338 TaxID=3365536 RepID=UPI0037186AEF